MSFNFNRNFPYLEIPSPTAEKSHMIDILYKTYMGKAVMYCTLARTSVIIVYVHKESIPSYSLSLF